MQNRQVSRGQWQAFCWGFFFHVFGLLVVTLTLADYREAGGDFPLGTTVAGVVASSVAWGFVLVLLTG